MSWKSLGYAIACVVVPVLWGIAVVWASNRVERFVLRHRKGSKRHKDQDMPRIEYHI
jgi:hypothetical protein